MKIPKIDTPAKLVSKWQGCVTCHIGEICSRKVFMDGSREPKFLFIGEGPGVSEDALGIPFIGPSGKLLRKALQEAGFSSRDWAFTNLVACRPCDGPRAPNRTPHEYEIHNCSERLYDTIVVLKPAALVAVGNVAWRNLNRMPQPTAHILHPAYILRRGGFKSREYPEYVRTLSRLKFNYRDIKGG